MAESPSSSKQDPIWNFFSSIRLAVFLFIALAVTSIIGTLIPQGEPLQSYLERYGPGFFQVIKLLKLHDAYHSWWFVSLLVFFSFNLIICTLKRFPFTLKLWKRDSLAVDAERLGRMPFKRIWNLKGNPAGAGEAPELFRKSQGSVKEKELDGGRLYLAERGKWSYWGLYGLHASVLVIFAGALVGLFFGFKGSIMLPEQDSADHIVDRRSGEGISLGFDIRCDKFFVDFYDTGAPKEFRSDLTVLEDGQEVLKKSIRVNDPLQYKGITFYQSSYQAVPEVMVRLTKADGTNQLVRVAAFEKTAWPEARMSFGLMQYLPQVHGVPAARIWMADETGPPQAVWVVKGQEKEVARGSNVFRMSMVDAKQSYMTGLQVKKDPGVWVVWLGCTGLLIGFVVVFWVPHRKVWLWVGSRDGKTVVVLSGQTNKNKIQFEKDFISLEEALANSLGGRS